MKKILFVCTGNTCRSCMAEGFLKTLLHKAGGRGSFEVSSAGISAYEGDSASSNAIDVLMEDYGINIENHVARSLDHSMVAEADIILTMTLDHKEAVIDHFPEAVSKVFTLKEFVSDEPAVQNGSYDYSFDIPDPYGMSLNAYKWCAADINKAVEKLVKKLVTNC